MAPRAAAALAADGGCRALQAGGPALTPLYGVREGGPPDVARVAAIKAASWADVYPGLVPDAVLRRGVDPARQREWTLRRLALPGALLLVATDPAAAAGAAADPAAAGPSATVAGFALSLLDNEPEPLLESLHVDPALRGRGIGRRLLVATAQRVAAAGRRSLQLDVVLGNERACRFYERLGGVPSGSRRETWGDADEVEEVVYRWPDVRLLAAIGGGEDA